MMPEEAHVILAARNVYNAGRDGDAWESLTRQQLLALRELAKACARLEISERRELARGRTSSVVRKLRLVK